MFENGLVVSSKFRDIRVQGLALLPQCRLLAIIYIFGLNICCCCEFHLHTYFYLFVMQCNRGVESLLSCEWKVFYGASSQLISSKSLREHIGLVMLDALVREDDDEGPLWYKSFIPYIASA